MEQLVGMSKSKREKNPNKNHPTRLHILRIYAMFCTLHSSQVMLWGRQRAERLPCFVHFPIEIPIVVEKRYGQRKEWSYNENKKCSEICEQNGTT